MHAKASSSCQLKGQVYLRFLDGSFLAKNYTQPIEDYNELISFSSVIGIVTVLFSMMIVTVLFSMVIVMVLFSMVIVMVLFSMVIVMVIVMVLFSMVIVMVLFELFKNYKLTEHWKDTHLITTK